MRKLLGMAALLLALQASAMRGARAAEAPGYFFRPGGGSGTIASGTANRIPRYTAATTIGDGSLTDDGAGSLGMPATAAGSNGAELSFSGATAGAATAANGNASGNISLRTEPGGDGDGTDKNGGAAGGIDFSGEAGGAATGTGTGGAGTSVTFLAGAGGAAAGVGGTSGAGGRINYTAGAPGAANGGTAGAYGWHQFTGYAKIVGQNDAVQLTVKGHSTQTSNLVAFTNSADAVQFSISNTGTMALAGPETITGDTDEVQLTVKAHSTQTNQVQVWKDTSGNVQLAVDGEGALNDGSSNWRIQMDSGGISGIRLLDASGTAYFRLYPEKYCSSPWFTPDAGRQRVASDVTNATTTMAAVTGLSATLQTNTGTKYSGTLVLYVNDSTAADGVKVDFGGGTCTVSSFRAQGFIADTVGVRPLAQTSALATDLDDATTTGDAMIVIKFSFVLSGDGTFIVQAAQKAHSTGTLTVYANSHMDLERRP